MNTIFPICYETFGDPHNPCIILISGIGSQLIDWPLTLTHSLADKGFYVVTFDNRDSGLSHHYDEIGVPNFNEAIAAKQQGNAFNPPYTLEDMASDVINLMDKLHIEKAHIAGVSMGGIIAQYIALNYPSRVMSLICIASTSGDPQLPSAKKEISEYFSSSMRAGDQSLKSIINKKLQLFKIYNHPDYFDEAAARKQIMLSYERAYYPEGFKRLLFAMICAEPRTDKLRKLKVPSLIIHGDYDPVFPLEHGKQLAAVIPNSHLEIIEKMGHGLPDIVCKKIVDLIVNYLSKYY